MILITLEEFTKYYNDLVYPVALRYLYEIADMNEEETKGKGLIVYRNITSSGNNLFNMVLWIGKEKDDFGNIAAGGLFRKKHFLAAIKIVARFDYKKPKDPIHIAGKIVLSWEELVDLMYENIPKEEPL